MPDSPKVMITRPLPHVAIATFCERVMVEVDGMYSLIRIFDTMAVNASNDQLHSLPPVSLNMFVLFKSDQATGTYNFQVKGYSPSGGEVLVGPGQPIVLGGEEQGSAVQAQIGIRPDAFGVYWFDILIDGQRVTRIPLRVHSAQAHSALRSGGAGPLGDIPQPE